MFAASPLPLSASVAENRRHAPKNSCSSGPPRGVAHRRCRVRRQEARQRAAAQAVRNQLAGRPGRRSRSPPPRSATTVTTTCCTDMSVGSDRQAQPDARSRAWPRCARSTARSSTKPTSSTTTCSSARSRARLERRPVQAVAVRRPHLRRSAAAAPSSPRSQPFKTVKDYDNWIARINACGVFIDQWIVLLGQGATERRTQPRVTIKKVLEQIKPQLVTDPEAERVLRAVQEDARQHRRRQQGPPHRRGQGRGADRGACRRSSASTSSSARSIYRRRATRSASTTRPDGERVLPQPHEVLHDHRQPRCGAHPQHRPRGSEAHPRRDGEDARGHQLPRHARSVPELHPQRSAVLSTRRRKS